MIKKAMRFVKEKKLYGVTVNLYESESIEIPEVIRNQGIRVEFFSLDELCESIGIPREDEEYRIGHHPIFRNLALPGRNPRTGKEDLFIMSFLLPVWLMQKLEYGKESEDHEAWRMIDDLMGLFIYVQNGVASFTSEKSLECRLRFDQLRIHSGIKGWYEMDWRNGEVA